MQPRTPPDPAPLTTPPAEVAVDADLVRELLAAQHPALAELPLTGVADGWDNAMYRLGDRLAVRLPRRASAAVLIEHEQRWLPRLAAALPLPIPVPVHVGLPGPRRPGPRYPWSWSVVPWLPGAPADQQPVAPDQAEVLAGFLRALHRPAPADAPVNPYRGVPLATRAELVHARLVRLAQASDAVTEPVRRAWSEALAAAPDDAPCWIHGDLHERNVLVDAGRLVGVVDWGDLCAGDRATDLAALWTLLDDPAARQRARLACAADPATWRRARGWAVSFGSLLLETGLADHPRHAAMGRAILRRLTEDDAAG